MTVRAVRATPIAMSDPPLRNAAGLHAPYALRIVLEVESSDGIIGLGEIPGDARTLRAIEAVSERLIGVDCYRLNTVADRIARAAADEDDRGDRPWDRRVTVHVQSAVEVACLDLLGKSVGRPVCDLLGGAVRDRVPFAAYLFFKERGAGGSYGFELDPRAAGWESARQEAAVDAPGIVAQAQAMCAEFGFRSIKLKGGTFHPDHEVDAVLALREAFGPEIPLRFDPNAVWSLETAVAMGRRLSGALEYYEDPVRGQEAMAELARRVDIPRATNMCTTSFDDIPGSVALGAEDIILADHHFWGGMRACIELGRICRTFNRGLSMHSNSHLGVSLAAMVHVASVIPNLTYALDTHYPWQREEIVAGGRFSFDEGALRVPREPGLGVELDRSRLEDLHRNYLSCGLTYRDDQTEMRKIEPGWTFQATRW